MTSPPNPIETGSQQTSGGEPRANCRARAPELALGSRWWMLPAIVAVLLAIAVGLIKWFDVDQADQPVAWMVVGGGMIGSASTAGILISPGRRRSHAVASAVLLGCAGTIFGWFEGDAEVWTVILIGVTAMQVATVRLTGWPRWRMRPSIRRKGHSVSIEWMLMLTALAGLLLASTRYFRAFDQVQFDKVVAVLGPLAIGWLAGQYAGGCRSEVGSRVLTYGVLVPLALAFWAQWSLGGWPSLDGRDFGQNVLGPLSAAVCTAIIHRQGRRGHRQIEARYRIDR